MKFKADKILAQLTIFAVIVLAISLWSICQAASLVWDYPGDKQWDIVTGYNVYYSDPAAQKFTKTIQKSDVTADATTIRYSNIEDKLQLRCNVEYTLYLTAFSEREESDPSNTCSWTLPGYEPPENHLPPAIIHIVGPVTITIRP